MTIRFLFLVVIVMIGCGKSKESSPDTLSFTQQTIDYSFSLEENDYTSHPINIIVKASGKSNATREYSLLIEEEGDATSNDCRIQSNLRIDPNATTDTVKVILYRTEKLKQQSLSVILRLGSNHHFRVTDNRTLTIRFNDITVIPKWWKTWEKQFGTYCKEKFVKWKELYPQGCDGEFYWDNMPPYAMKEYYPQTFYRLELLKNYFDNHVIYPDGDDTKERITIPLAI